jgi:hypothetical protein
MTPRRATLGLTFCSLLACSAGAPRRSPAADASGPEDNRIPSEDASGAGGIGGAAGDHERDSGGAPEADGPSIDPDAEEIMGDAALEDGAGNSGPDGGAGGKVDWANCGDPKTEAKAGVSSAEFCAEFAIVCGFGRAPATTPT